MALRGSGVGSVWLGELRPFMETLNVEQESEDLDPGFGGCPPKFFKTRVDVSGRGTYYNSFLVNCEPKTNLCCSGMI